MEKFWESLPETYPGLQALDRVIMPSHVHAIVRLPGGGLPLGTIIGRWKAGSAHVINQDGSSPHRPFWQRGFYDRVVRSDEELGAIRDYLRANPIVWEEGRSGPIGPFR